LALRRFLFSAWASPGPAEHNALLFSSPLSVSFSAQSHVSWPHTSVKASPLLPPHKAEKDFLLFFPACLSSKAGVFALLQLLFQIAHGAPQKLLQLPSFCSGFSAFDNSFPQVPTQPLAFISSLLAVHLYTLSLTLFVNLHANSDGLLLADRRAWSWGAP
jgi:hypothetical protein